MKVYINDEDLEVGDLCDETKIDEKYDCVDDNDDNWDQRLKKWATFRNINIIYTDKMLTKKISRW